jgi:hypothetical protein
MDLIISIDNFMDGGNYREVNSPRTLEACLRSGLDPSELAPKPRGAFVTKELTKTMVDAKFQLYEKKRQDKISTVTQERQSLIKFAMRKSASQPGSPDPNHTGLLANNPKGGGSNLIEMVRFLLLSLSLSLPPSHISVSLALTAPLTPTHLHTSHPPP